MQQTAETVEVTQGAVNQTDEMTYREAVKQTAEIAADSVEAMKQAIGTDENLQTVDVVDRQGHTEDAAENKHAVTLTEENREDQQTVQYSDETVKAIEGL